MRFLLTNDDGIEAEGLLACADLLSEFGEVSVIAPAVECSGCGHQVTVERPMTLSERRPGWYALDGKPADCVRVALAHLKLDVDWVISGINPGGNLGADVFMSGTVAAVREAALWGRSGIAISQYRLDRTAVDWSRARRWSREALKYVFEQMPAAPNVYWNVNLPDPVPTTTANLASADSAINSAIPPLIECPTDANRMAIRYEATEAGLHYRGRYKDRDQTPGRDVAHCFGGAITLSRLTLTAD